MSYKNNAISSDDPKAIEKLTDKLNKCETEQEFMKKVNSYYKKNGTCVGCEGVSDELAAKLDENINRRIRGINSRFRRTALQITMRKYAA